MNFKILKHLGNKKFRRFVGIKKKTFMTMVKILTLSKLGSFTKGGRPPKLCIEDMLLATLQYWREYRTYFHIGTGFGVSESTVFNIVRWVESVLIKDSSFRLPGRKALFTEMTECILIDATECPIERPKKARSIIIQAKRKGIL
jgi:Helix-turn-helix of DDE superfamily endonuclease